MTDMLFTLLSAALIGNLVLLMPLAVDPLARQQVHALGLATTLQMLLSGVLGFWLVLNLFNYLRQHIADNAIPLPFRGLPVEMISAGLMAVAFLGFNAMIKA